jgi:hypothetical protein
MAQDAKKASRIEKKLKVLLGGYQVNEAHPKHPLCRLVGIL